MRYIRIQRKSINIITIGEYIIGTSPYTYSKIQALTPISYISFKAYSPETECVVTQKASGQ